MVSTSKEGHLSTKCERIVGSNRQLLHVDNDEFFLLSVKTAYG